MDSLISLCLLFLAVASTSCLVQPRTVKQRCLLRLTCSPTGIPHVCLVKTAWQWALLRHLGLRIHLLLRILRLSHPPSFWPRWYTQLRLPWRQNKRLCPAQLLHLYQSKALCQSWNHRPWQLLGVFPRCYPRRPTPSLHLDRVLLHLPLLQGPLLLKVSLHLLFPHSCWLFCLQPLCIRCPLPTWRPCCPRIAFCPLSHFLRLASHVPRRFLFWTSPSLLVQASHLFLQRQSDKSWWGSLLTWVTCSLVCLICWSRAWAFVWRSSCADLYVQEAQMLCRGHHNLDGGLFNLLPYPHILRPTPLKRPIANINCSSWEPTVSSVAGSG